MVWGGASVVSAIVGAIEHSSKVDAQKMAAVNFFKSYMFLEWLAKPSAAPLSIRQFLNQLERSGGDREVYLQLQAAVSLFKMWKARDVAADVNTIGSRVAEAISEITAGTLDASTEAIMEEAAK